ncbi:MAG: hypothetical protein H6719_38830, partial [Sandaracinaceae bacterium]|nr:hypothetical protein [Sandaracinaceae bacterium]
ASAATALALAGAGGAALWTETSAPVQPAAPEPVVGAAAAPPAEPAAAADSGSLVQPAEELARVEAPAVVTVSLRGVPEGARVRVDGEALALDGEPLELPRDGRAHVIEVRSGRRRWRGQHVADADGSLSVRFPPRAPRRARPGVVFREPDF